MDVLTYRGSDDRHTDLKVPHPFIEQRSFVVVPAFDIATEELVRGRRIRDLAAAMDTTDCVSYEEH